MMNMFKLLRVHHWVKNLFIVLPVPFAIASGSEVPWVQFVWGLFAFSLINSSIYCLNDVVDESRDRLHPDKMHRPIASGSVGRKQAIYLAMFLLATSWLILITEIRSPEAMWITGIYLLLNLIYSLWARDVPVVDVVFLGTFFSLRILFGCALLAVIASPRLLLCGTSIALLLAMGKRRAELEVDPGGDHRRSLSWYSAESMSSCIRVLAFLIALEYAEYCWVSPWFLAGRWWWSPVPVLIGLWYYQYLILIKRDRRSPVELFIQSRWIQLILIIWCILIATSIRW